MASVVQAVARATAVTNQNSATLAVNGTVAGNGLIVPLRVWNTGTVSSITVSCNGESNLTEVGTRFYVAARGMNYIPFVLPSISTGGNKTITVSFGGFEYFMFDALEVSGHNKSSFYASQATGSNAASANPSVNVIPAQIGDIIVAMCDGSHSSLTNGANYTLIQTADQNEYSVAQYRVAAVSGSQSVPFSMSSGGWMMGAYVFNNAAAAAPRLHAVERSRSIARGILRGV